MFVELDLCCDMDRKRAALVRETGVEEALERGRHMRPVQTLPVEWYLCISNNPPRDPTRPLLGGSRRVVEQNDV